MKSALALSPLPHTWLIDIDGTMLLHNGHKDDREKILPGVKDFWKKIPEQDVIILMTARTPEYMELTFALLKQNGLRYHHAIFNLPLGERIMINDQKPGGLMTAVAVNVPRNYGLIDLDVVIREDL